MNNSVQSFFERIGVVAALIFAACAVAMLSTPVAGAASSGFVTAPGGTPLYTWGNNTNGQLGFGDYGLGTQRSIPTRVGDADNWAQVATANGGAIALNDEGHIYQWGASWTAPQMGQGDNPANPGTGFITVPTRVGDRDDWVYVSFSGTHANAINDQGHLYTWGDNASGRLGHGDTVPRSVPTRVDSENSWASSNPSGGGNFTVAITTDGHMYAWGSNASGQLGLGHTGGSYHTPQRVGTATDWANVALGNACALAINSNGEIFTWGLNIYGQLGQGDMGSGTQRTVPTQVGTATDWVTIASITSASAAINSNGEIFTWGSSELGRLGRSVTAENPQYLPGRMGNADNWVAIGTGNSHFLALNEHFELYAWGNNAYGQLGIGTISEYESEPAFVLQAYGFAGFSQAGAGMHSMALIRTTPVDISLTLTKSLQKPTGTSVPNLTFSFTFTPHSFNNNTTNLTPLPPIPARTITIDDTSTSSPNSPTTGITTTASSIDALADIEFTQPGIFAWTIAEVQTATGIGSNSEVDFSQASYRLRVYVSQGGVGAPLEIYAVTIHRLTDSAGNTITPPYKTNAITFTNTYTRTRPTNALLISKAVTGNFADMTTPFDFQVTLTRTPFCPPATEFVGRVVDISNNPVYTTGPSPEPRVYTFANATTRTVTLTHSQRLVFDSLLVGTRFNVTELASAEFIASVALQVDGQAVPIDPNTVPNTNLSIGNHYLGTQGNSAAFTNNHHFIPPTGLSIANSTSALPLFLATVATLAILTHKARRRVEEVPTLN